MVDKADKVIKLPVPVSQTADAKQHADADTKRRETLFEWADEVLRKIGIRQAVATATSIVELHRIAFNPDSDAEIALAIRDALYPAYGERQEHFRGLREGGLKQVLKNRFAELKKARQAELQNRRGRQTDWTGRLHLNKDGEIVPNLANLVVILQEAPKWHGVLAYNEFAARVIIRKSPPWGAESAGTEWADHHDSRTRVWFQTQSINARIEDVGRAVQLAARHNAFHPARSYYDALVWDGAPRLDTWLICYFGALDTPYVRAVGSRFLISSMARIYRPGCKADYVLGLEGRQGIGKSEGLRALMHDEAWFTDRLSSVASKDAALEVAGLQLIEIAEMEGLIRATSFAAKAYLSRRVDRFRPPHGRYPIRVPRQCVFAYTLNPPKDGRYLKDPTGARRSWPVCCHGMVDIAGIIAVRDQLWAEALHRYKAGAPWWLETLELEALATAEQDARFVIDPFEEHIREWLGNRTDIRLTDVLIVVSASLLGVPDRRRRPPCCRSGGRLCGFLLRTYSAQGAGAAGVSGHNRDTAAGPIFQPLDFSRLPALGGLSLLPQLGIHLGAGIVSSIIVATIGAIILLVILRLVNRGGRW